MPIACFHRRIVALVLIFAMAFSMLPATAFAAPPEDAAFVEEDAQGSAAEEAAEEEPAAAQAAVKETAPTIVEESLTGDPAAGETLSADRILSVSLEMDDGSGGETTVPLGSGSYVFDESSSTLIVTLDTEPVWLSDNTVRILVKIMRPADAVTHCGINHFDGTSSSPVPVAEDGSYTAGVGMMAYRYDATSPQVSQYWYTDSSGTLYSEDRYYVRLIQSFLDSDARIYPSMVEVQVSGREPAANDSTYKRIGEVGIGYAKVGERTSVDEPWRVNVYLSEEPKDYWLSPSNSPGGRRLISIVLRLNVPRVEGQSIRGLGTQWEEGGNIYNSSLKDSNTIGVGSFNFYEGTRRPGYRVVLHWYTDEACTELAFTETLLVDIVNAFEPFPVPAERIALQTGIAGAYRSDGLAVYPKDGLGEAPYTATAVVPYDSAVRCVYREEYEEGGGDAGALEQPLTPGENLELQTGISRPVRWLLSWYNDADDIIACEYVDIGFPRLGDIDGNDAVSLTDAVLLARAIVSGDAFGDLARKLCADVNADGAVDVTDVLQVCGKLAGKEYDIMQKGG